MVRIRSSRDGKNPYPFRLIGTAASGFYRTCFDKEPTLSQARTKLDSVFMADNRCFLE
ncbi:hypothetical protein [Pontiella sulfatireligans]|uniref:hypothetical protein n=1 Tax=Pontiella sulfatireligans TaxID=2750658 RepID=UPI0014446485|nr:hypothetical protein [Pontiella sulfatireligans]